MKEYYKGKASRHHCDVNKKKKGYMTPGRNNLALVNKTSFLILANRGQILPSIFNEKSYLLKGPLPFYTKLCT